MASRTDNHVCQPGRNAEPTLARCRVVRPPARVRKLFIITAALIVVAALVATTATAQSSPVQILSATVNADRSVSLTWNVPAGPWGGVVIVNPTSTTDASGEMQWQPGSTVSFATLASGAATYTTEVFSGPITEPVTLYAQVQLTDPLGNGGCGQGAIGGVNCDSQVVAMTLNPICAQVLAAPAYDTKVLARRGHWVKRKGRRVWVKPVYRRVHHPATYTTQCH